MRNLPRILHWLPLLAGLVLPAALRAAESPAPFSPEQIHFFEKEIRPLLIERCQDCHGAHKHENGLRLDSRAAVVRGSDYGPVVVAGKPAESKLIHALHGQNGAEKMPKKGAPLSETQIAAMTRWIQEGLPWPAETEVAATEEKNDPHQHWAFLPVVKPAVPAMSPEAGKNEVDAFVGAKLQAAGLDFAEPATAADLCRRLHVTLTGLQPLPDRVRAFEKDFATDVDAAVAALVDELLASEHYGERWARHWLDVARYSDTEGYT
ncbi:MAG: DUF1549 domain-containing protein, partial [Verrucomicrobiales bacterium]|nr:DUF1549 domain-containing protein [Verrucomicrobiales bacterium]